MAYYKLQLKKKDAHMVFWMPIFFDFFLVISEMAMLCVGLESIKDDIRSSGQMSTYLVYGSVIIYGSLGCTAVLHITKLIFAVYGNRGELTETAHVELRKALFMHIMDSCFMLPMGLFHSKQFKGLMDMQEAGETPYFGTNMKIWEIPLRWMPLTVMWFVLGFGYTVVWENPWFVGFFVSLLFYAVTVIRRMQYDAFIKLPRHSPTITSTARKPTTAARKPVPSEIKTQMETPVATTLTPASTPQPSVSTTPNAFDTPTPSAPPQETVPSSSGSVYRLSSPQTAAQRTPTPVSGSVLTLHLPTMQMITPTQYNVVPTRYSAPTDTRISFGRGGTVVYESRPSYTTITEEELQAVYRTAIAHAATIQL